MRLGWVSFDNRVTLEYAVADAVRVRDEPARLQSMT